MSREKKEMHPKLKKIYDTIKNNNNYISLISEDINGSYSSINSFDFEGITKDYFAEALQQISSEISGLAITTNNIITKENHLNNDFRSKLEKYKKDIEKYNELVDNEARLEAQIAEVQRIEAEKKALKEGKK